MSRTTSTTDRSLVDLTIQLPANMVDTLHEIVTENNVDLSALISGYVSNGIEHDLPEVHKKCFLKHIKEVLKKHNVPSEAIDEIGDKFSY